MFGWLKSKPPIGSDLPRWRISPAPHGKWDIELRRYFPSIRLGGSGFYYMQAKYTYDTIEEAQADAKHLGLEA